MTPLYMGIDPGAHGAIALLAYEQGKPMVKTFDIPTFKITVNKKSRTRVDLSGINTLLFTYRAHIMHAIIEDVHAMPGQGVTSSFSFGFVCGVLQAMLVAHDLPMTVIAPASWKRKLGLTHDKDDTRRRASQIFPTCAHQWTRKCDDGRAEAALLAYYGQVEGISL